MTRAIEKFPLSFGQERLWFLHQFDPLDNTYNQITLQQIDGPLDTDSLRRAFDLVHHRHSILRTRYGSDDGVGHQWIDDEWITDFYLKDYSSAPFEQAFCDLTTEMLMPFDLRVSLPMRIRVYQVSTSRYLLGIVIHHIASDGWSHGILMRELEKIYTGYADGAEPALDPVNQQYFEFALEQRRSDGSDEASQGRDYWTNNLTGAEPIDLPTVDIAGSSTDQCAERLEFTFPPELINNLKRFASEQTATPFMVLMATLQLLFYRLTGQRDISIGTPFLGRNLSTSMETYGFFINSLVIRSQVEPSHSFAAFLDKVKNTCIEAFENQAYPFEKIVEQLEVERNPARHPLYDIMLNMTGERAGLNLPGVSTTPLEPPEGQTNLALNLFVRQRQDTLTLSVVYRSALFSRKYLVEFVEQFQLLLRSVFDAPQTALDAFSLRTPLAAARLPDPTHPIPHGAPPRAIAAMHSFANSKGDAVAVRWGETALNYEALSVAVKRLGSTVEFLSQPGDAIAINGERCPAFVIATLAILERGRIVVPIDPDLPQRRKQSMATTAGVKWVMNVLGSDDDVDWIHALNLPLLPITAEDGRAEIADETLNDALDTPRQNPAYIMFTSGSTGEPKPIAGTLEGLDHFADWQSATFSVNSSDAVAQLAHLSFDVLFRELLTPLCRGASVIIPSRRERADPLPCVLASGATMVNVVPTLLCNWLEHLPDQHLQGHALRLIFLAGEALTQNHVELIRQKLGDHVQLINLYGPSETTMVKSYYPVPQVLDATTVSIGQGIEGADLLILSDAGLPCGIGERGEIFVKTPYRTLGYFRRPEATAERFIHHPATGTDDTLLYRTGDDGYYDVEGNAHYLGRRERQLKVRGVRIYPPAVESCVVSHSCAERCHITKRSYNDVEQLVAYVTVEQDCSFDAESLQQTLYQFLPVSMIPTRFAVLDGFPILPNGKIDESRLPEPEITTAETYEAPNTELEHIVINALRHILGDYDFTVNKSPMQLGCDSLSATRVLSRVATDSGIEISHREFFECASVRALCRDVEERLQT